MAAEGDLRKKLKARVEAYGGEIRALSYLGRRGAPDVLCLFTETSYYAIRFGVIHVSALHPLIETKAPKKGPTIAQANEHTKLREAGFNVLVISTEDQLDDWLPPLC